MSSLREHISTLEGHGALTFHPDCPLCRAERQLGRHPSRDALISPKARAGLAAGVLAAATLAPTGTAFAQGPPDDGVVEGDLPPEIVNEVEAELNAGGDVDEPPEQVDAESLPEDPESLPPDDEEDLGGFPQGDDEADTPVEGDETGMGAPEAPEDTPDAPSPAGPKGGSGDKSGGDKGGGEKGGGGETRGESKQGKGDQSRGQEQPAPPANQAPAPTTQPPPAQDQGAGEGTAQDTSGSNGDSSQAAGTAGDDGNGGGGGSAPAPGGKVHVVASGESLWSIARDLLGDDATPAKVAALVDQLWRLNADRIGSGDPSMIHVGDQLQLPK